MGDDPSAFLESFSLVVVLASQSIDSNAFLEHEALGKVLLGRNFGSGDGELLLASDNGDSEALLEGFRRGHGLSALEAGGLDALLAQEFVVGGKSSAHLGLGLGEFFLALNSENLNAGLLRLALFKPFTHRSPLVDAVLHRGADLGHGKLLTKSSQWVPLLAVRGDDPEAIFKSLSLVVVLASQSLQLDARLEQEVLGHVFPALDLGSARAACDESK